MSPKASLVGRVRSRISMKHAAICGFPGGTSPLPPSRSAHVTVREDHLYGLAIILMATAISRPTRRDQKLPNQIRKYRLTL